MQDTLVIDLETKHSFAEVGGEANIRKLGISVAGIYSYARDEFFAYEEQELPKLEELLAETSHIIGFNIKYFDLPVLEPYLKKVSLARFALTDMYEQAVNFLGHRVGLNALAKATLGTAKSGHGLEALEWFKEGRVEEVKKYCLDDVRITRDLYEFGKKNGYVLFESYVDGKVHSIPATWGKEINPAFPEKDRVNQPMLNIVEKAYQQRKRLVISYVSSQNADGLGFTKERMIDIYKIKKNEIEAFCHLRGGLRNFRLDRILKAEVTGEKYLIPQDFQKTLF